MILFLRVMQRRDLSLFLNYVKECPYRSKTALTDQQAVLSECQRCCLVPYVPFCQESHTASFFLWLVGLWRWRWHYLALAWSLPPFAVVGGPIHLCLLGVVWCRRPYGQCKAGWHCWGRWPLWKLCKWIVGQVLTVLQSLRWFVLFVALFQNHKATGLDSATVFSSKYAWCNYLIPQIPVQLGILVKVKVSSRVKPSEVLFPTTPVSSAVSAQSHTFSNNLL